MLRPRSIAHATAAFTLVALLAACGSRREAANGPQPRTSVKVDNQSSLDMNIYVLPENGSRVRLGTATAHLQTTFTIPPNLIFGISSLRFLADPIGSNRTPISDQIAVTPGDQVVLRIPPGV